jgi:hypothetical protein
VGVTWIQGSKKGTRMGNRSLIVVENNTDDTQITIYGHWSGTENLTAVRNVLSTTGRVGDCYLVAELFYEFAVALGGFSGVGYGSFGIWAGKRGDDEGWTDAPTIYVNQDTGEYRYEDEVVTLDQLLDPNKSKEEPQIIYGSEK